MCHVMTPSQQKEKKKKKKTLSQYHQCQSSCLEIVCRGSKVEVRNLS